MKFLGLIAAGLLGAATLAPASASAAPAVSAVVSGAATLAVAGVQGEHRTVVVRERTVRRGPAARWGSRRVCTNRWSHGRKIRSCRAVRYRR